MRVKKTVFFKYLSWLIFLCVFSAQAASKEAGKIARIKGEVRIDDVKGKIVASSKESPNRRHLKDGSPIYIGDIVKTFGDARVKIEFHQGGPNGNNSVVLGGDTVLAIEDVSEKAGSKNTTLKLYEGQVRNDVNAKYDGKPGNSYEVKTLNAVAGVRGTVFTAGYKSGQTFFATQQGEVMVQSLSAGASAPAISVKPGTFTSVDAQGAPAAPAPISSNPSLNAQVEGLAVDPGTSSSSDERLPAGGSEAGPKGSSSTSTESSAAPASEPAATKAPMFREEEKAPSENRSPAASTASSPMEKPKIAGISKASAAAPPPAAPVRFAGESQMRTPQGQAMSGVMERVQGISKQVTDTKKTDAAASTARGVVCVVLKEGGTCN